MTRPALRGEPGITVGIRLTPDEIAILDRLAEGIGRAAAIAALIRAADSVTIA